MHESGETDSLRCDILNEIATFYSPRTSRNELVTQFVTGESDSAPEKNCDVRRYLNFITFKYGDLDIFIIFFNGDFGHGIQATFVAY